MFPCVILKNCALEISKCQAICGSVICMERTRGGWLIQREGELLEEIRTGDPAGCMGLSCLLVLPQAFGAIYLGETFCSNVSVGNHSSYEVRDVVIKAEMQTERQRLVLSDTSKSPIESIRAGGRYDFI